MLYSVVLLKIFHKTDRRIKKIKKCCFVIEYFSAIWKWMFCSCPHPINPSFHGPAVAIIQLPVILSCSLLNVWKINTDSKFYLILYLTENLKGE